MTSPYASLIEQEIFCVPSFTLESGVILKEVPVAYKTWGKLNETRDNVMVICHAFTGSSAVEDWYVYIPNGLIPQFDTQISIWDKGGDRSWDQGRPLTLGGISYFVQTLWALLTVLRLL